MTHCPPLDPRMRKDCESEKTNLHAAQDFYTILQELSDRGPHCFSLSCALVKNVGKNMQQAT